MSDVESDPEEDLFHSTLSWRGDDLNELIHRFDALIYLNRKYAPYLLDQKHQATTKSNKFDPTRVGLFIS